MEEGKKKGRRQGGKEERSKTKIADRFSVYF